jgi:hypothetical protein
MDLVRFTTPALAATKGLCKRAGTRPRTDAIFNTRPDFWASIGRTAARLTKNSPVRSTFTMRFHSSSGN